MVSILNHYFSRTKIYHDKIGEIQYLKTLLEYDNRIRSLNHQLKDYITFSKVRQTGTTPISYKFQIFDPSSGLNSEVFRSFGTKLGGLNSENRGGLNSESI